MVKVKEGTPLLPDGSIDLEQWLSLLAGKGYFQDLEKIRHACTLSQLSGSARATEAGQSCLQQGLAMADVLADLEVDQETIAAAIMIECVHYAGLSIDDVEEQLGPKVAKLVNGVEKMSAISSLQSSLTTSLTKHQIDNVRKMLLAMVDDVRVALIKLAERLCVLRALSPMPEEIRQRVATEVMEIYAPLANRLGIGAIKWEMEDLAFRYLHPVNYKAIASGLKAKRLERDRYVNLIVTELNQHIKTLGVDHFAVYGRSKHIHSIYRKMQRKNVPLGEIYDATAVRILVETEAQCYEVLSLVHTLWQQIPHEFDDYINKPKANGYRSLHTAVLGPENCVFEVQIRTFKMHELAEMGVAAHWKYKEGVVKAKESHERKIEWLRDVLAWHKEMALNQGVSADMESEFFEERIYVFTPDGDILDLPRGTTALDFAYHVHSEVGHRCRGAKVNGHIVPLTYKLSTGDKVEVLTGKEARPSRDWVNPHLHYLTTARSRAKVLHWFKMQDYAQHKIIGKEALEKELKTLGIKIERIQDLIESLGFKTFDDLLASIGRGDFKISQVLSKLTPTETPVALYSSTPKSKHHNDTLSSNLAVEGVNNLLTHMARCCQPVPGDDVVGYVTLGRGISVHRKDCNNIVAATDRQRQRFLTVNWGAYAREQYMVDIAMKAFDRPDLLRDVTALLAVEKTQIYALQTQLRKQDNTMSITLTVEIDGVNRLSRLLALLGQIPNVLEARRQVYNPKH